MKFIIHNRKYNDEILFEIDELTEKEMQIILSEVHLRGWEDKDCWIEFED